MAYARCQGKFSRRILLRSEEYLDSIRPQMEDTFRTGTKLIGLKLNSFSSGQTGSGEAKL